MGDAICSEEWREIPGHEGRYQVSNLGRVRGVRGGILKPNVYRGYARVGIWTPGQSRPSTTTVHSLVALAFLGPRPEGQEVCHANGVRDDNRLANLRYDTSSANKRDTVLHGHDPQAEQTHCTHGHEFTPENTRLTREGWRRCVACCRLSNVRTAQRRKAERRARRATRAA